MKRSGVEPDECYLIGADQARDIPDLAIEVVWTSGGIDELEAYRRLGLREVWFWKASRLDVYVLEGEAYVERDRSTVLPGLDPRWLCTFLEHPTATQAIKAFRAALAEPK